MQQLDSTDTRLVEREALGPPQHISTILIYDPPATPIGHLHYRDILATIKRNLDKSAVFRRRLLRAPLNMDRPYWAEDDSFDLDYHVRHIALPQPGNWPQLRQLLARLHAVRLDMSRPLWEAYVIEGLNELPGHRPGSFALLLKVHHSAIANDDLVNLINGLHLATPASNTLPAANRQWHAAPAPTTLHMLTRAYINGLRYPTTLFQAAVRHTPLLSKLAPQSQPAPPQQHDTRFNAPVTEERVTDMLLIQRTSVQSIMACVKQATAYDVVVCIIGGALRAYLTEKNELPAVPLTLALGANGAVDSATPNHTTAPSASVNLGSDIDDPLERLRAVHTSVTAPAPQTHGVIATTALWPAPEMGGATSSRLLASLTQDDPAYLASTRLSGSMAMPALRGNMGLVHSALRHQDTISLMFVACRALLPDPDNYLRCLQHSLHQLSTAARQAEP